MGLGPLQTEVGYNMQWVGRCNLFQIFKIFSKLPQLLPLQKYKTLASHVQKISKLCRLEDKCKGNNFSFAKKFKIQMNFEIKIQETNQISIWFVFKKVQTFEEKFNKFTKNLS
jgi:hypothetical protein